MSTYRHPELVLPDAQPRLTPRNQLLAENMLKTTRLYVRRRIHLSMQQSNKKSISYWLDQKHPHFKPGNSACDRLFAVQELADAIFAHLDDFHDIACCLAVNRTIRHAVQQSVTPVRVALPFKECEDPHLLYMEKQLDLATATPYWQRHSQRFFMNSGNIVFPRNAPMPMLVSIYDVVNTIGELRRGRVAVDIWFSATGHTPKDFKLDGSWLNLSLPLPDTVVWMVNITCDCHRTVSFLNRLDYGEEVNPRIYKDGTPLVFPYKLVTEYGDHLRQIAVYAKKAYRMHRHCRNDSGDIPSGLSSITFEALKRKRSGFDLIDPSTYSTRPSPKFRAKSSNLWSSQEIPREKTRREILDALIIELAALSPSLSWDQMKGSISSNDELLGIVVRRSEHIPSEEFIYTLKKLGRLSAWDKLMGRTEMKLGY